MNILCIGDVMIPGEQFARACQELSVANPRVEVADWETNWDRLQNRRLAIEKHGPDAEPVLAEIQRAHQGTEMLFVLFAPVSAAAMDTLPNLRLIGASRAGTENVDVPAATERGIVVHNIMGRNAQAVSDFAVALLLAEARNIARAHHAIKTGQWRKNFVNSDFVPELSGKTVGIIGFGHIGRLVAKKLSGFEVNVLVYDPFVADEVTAQYYAHKVSKEVLFGEADFVTVHARLTEETQGLVGADELNRMKPTAILINTARAGLIDEAALYDALKSRKIAGAALDVFWIEPLAEDSRWLELDNVTLTSHIAGTTADALNNSPYLLTRDVNKLLTGESAEFVVNPEVLDHPRLREWLQSLQK
jgi:D-3-phosphoglycerate dehydrogenase